MDNKNLMSVEEFINQAKRFTMIKLSGYLAFNNEHPNVIFFGRDIYQCPQYPIPKDRIQNIQLGSSHFCRLTSGGPGIMWEAIVYLKEPDLKNTGETFFARLLTEYLVDHPTDEWYCYELFGECVNGSFMVRGEGETSDIALRNGYENAKRACERMGGGPQHYDYRECWPSYRGTTTNIQVARWRNVASSGCGGCNKRIKGEG